MKEQCNWWDDPKNKEEVERISWWDHPENQITIELPVAVIQDDKYWCVTASKETEKLIGDNLGGCSQGESREEAIKEFFSLIKWHHEFINERMLSYERWVPFRKGQWNKTGGTWFVIFGLHFYFRYGKQNKGGFFIPFTWLNISFYSEWITYRNYKRERAKRENEIRRVL